MSSLSVQPGSRRSLWGVAAVAAAGLLLAAWPLAQLLWLALCAPALGVLAARCAAPPLSALLPLAWTLPVLALAGPGLPTPLWGACAAAGLYAVGLGLGTLALARGGDAWTCSGLLFLATLALAALPARAALARDPWPPALARRLLDLSPTALVLECAGADWMRHESVYEPVGSDRFERRAWGGKLAGPTLLLVGYAFAAAAHLAARRSAARGAPA